MTSIENDLSHSGPGSSNQILCMTDEQGSKVYGVAH